MSYKDELTAAMDALAGDPKACFIGYGVRYGGRAMGTLCNINEVQLIETPVAENLMVGLAIGLALKGRKPVVFIERFDFILNALDAIVNHLDKIAMLSQQEFSPNIILRVVIGNTKKPLYTGLTHTQDFTEAVKQLVEFPVFRLTHPGQIRPAYHQAMENLPYFSTMLIEEKDRI